MYRYERPQSGRNREFTQWGFECFGSDDVISDAEVISLAYNAYRLLGLDNVCVRLNTLGDDESRNNYRDALVSYFRPHIDSLCEDCKNRLEKNPLRILDCKVDAENEIMASAPKILDYLNEESKKRFDSLCELLDLMDINYEVDQKLVRGLDYYNHTVFEITLNNGSCKRTILKEYVNPSFTTEAGLTEILGDMKTFAPAESYSMIIGCHGTGWLPVVQSRSKAKEDFVYHWDFENVPMTRFFGGLTAEYQTNISTLAQSLSNNGLSMEYILFDDCYMSSLEVAYELRHVTNYMIACPTEVMVFGMPYSTIGKYLLSEKPDYKAICESFYQFYSNYQYPYGTLAVTDCSYLDELAELMKYIHSNYSFDSTQAINIQRMDGYSPVIFYDFGDYVQTLCGTDTEIYNNFKTLLEKVIPYKTHTKEFYTASRGPITVERYSGITTSEPSTNSKMVDYPKTSWCIDTH